MATWLTTSASRGGIHEDEKKEEQQVTRIMHLKAHDFFGEWDYGVRFRTFVWFKNVRLRSRSDRDSFGWETSIPFF